MDALQEARAAEVTRAGLRRAGRGRAIRAWQADACWIAGHAELRDGLWEDQRLAELGAHVSGVAPG